MVMTLVDIRWQICSPYYINYDDTKIVCRKCGEEFDIDNIDEDFFFDHFIKDFAKDKKVQEFFQMLKDQGWQKKNVTIGCKPLPIYSCPECGSYEQEHVEYGNGKYMVRCKDCGCGLYGNVIILDSDK